MHFKFTSEEMVKRKLITQNNVMYTHNLSLNINTELISLNEEN